MHELLPEHADMLVGIPVDNGLARMQEVGVSGPVPISVHGELEGFEAMVLRQKGHESAEGIWWGGKVEQNVSQGWRGCWACAVGGQRHERHAGRSGRRHDGFPVPVLENG